jgi:hypothetical protein
MRTRIIAVVSAALFGCLVSPVLGQQVPAEISGRPAESVQAFERLPQSTMCRRIDFNEVQVRPGFISKTYFLIVSGVKPWITMDVRLMPLIYVVKPEYWGIEVIGCQSGIGLPMEWPYTKVLRSLAQPDLRSATFHN